eukprot:CAMPEP_0182430962 /NCGR_PEP_ID=MMETSP1167-20130531/45227_1 /TAXON_ID=2988 /ORGANISM="Mallomonas Sp, Strain CCMP3275" /LENGTH=250 /DNA_ID=CAMNT_0024616739 /DNA_START=1 /DNA_END=753 /DNA_ORIENTATION=-
MHLSALAPERVILDPLPKLYVYDHCPFCVRSRLGLGLKNVKHNLIFLANDDIPTPTALVGKKISPIFEADGVAMPESFEIVIKVDSDPKYGPTGLFKPLSSRTDIKAWQKSVATPNRILNRPRYMKTALPEFMQQDGKDAFVRNHALPPYEKAEWKALSMADQWALYDKAYEESFALIDEASESLKELEPMLYSSEYCTEGGVSYDDIDLFSRLRSLTLVKGLVWPEKLRAYMEHFSKMGDVPLLDSMAV